jgi:hypothetical protein
MNIHDNLAFTDILRRYSRIQLIQYHVAYKNLLLDLIQRKE